MYKVKLMKKHRKIYRHFPVLWLICFYPYFSSANSDTLRLTFDKADSLFINKNLSLLAYQYNISIAKAMKIQAKLYPNPQVYIEQSLVNSYTRKNYDQDPTRTGNTETILQVQQLILLAGKRNKQIALADVYTKMTETDFENLIRSLKQQLHEDLAQLYYNNKAIRLLREEKENIENLSEQLMPQYSKGYVSLNETVRIKSLVFELEKNLNEISSENYHLVSEINILLGNAPNVIVEPKISLEVAINNNLLAITNYIDSAFVYNPDIKKSNYMVDYAKAQHALNKALAIPDANVQLVYDKSGNYIKNYYGLGLGIQLPTWNRNQGNIKASKLMIDQNETVLKQDQLTISSGIIASYNTFINNQKILMSFKEDYEKQLLQLMDQVLENYKKRLLTMNEFINYYESYKQSYLSLLDLKSQLLQNAEQLNFLIGKTIINYY